MSTIKRFFTGASARRLYSAIFCIVVGLAIGLLVMVILSPNDSLYDFSMMMTGGLLYYGYQGLGNILATMAPLICCGVGIIFAYRTGIFNIGAAGQYIFGMFGALTFALFFKAPWYACILMAIVCGALWGVIPALLKVFFNINEVISGIMLNWVALFFVNYSFQTYLRSIVDPGNSFKTVGVADTSPGSFLPNFGIDKNMFGPTLTCGVLIAVLVAIAAFIVMEKTTFGYQLKASGYNHHAAKYAGINFKKNSIITMAISGGIIGLGAALFYLADIDQWSAQVSTVLPNLPWTGIIIAFIAQLNPIGAIGVSALISVISTGSTAMSQSTYPKEISDLITAVIVYLSGLSAFMMRFIPWLKSRFRRKVNIVLEEQPLKVKGKKGKPAKKGKPTKKLAKKPNKKVVKNTKKATKKVAKKKGGR